MHSTNHERFGLAFFACLICITTASCSRHGNVPKDPPAPQDLLLFNQPQLVAHAKTLFTRLTSGKAPAWESQADWQDQCDVGLMNNCVRLSKDASRKAHFIHSLEDPPQAISATHYITKGTDKAPVPKILQTIYYSHSAAVNITANELNDASKLERRRKLLENHKVPLSELNVPDFAPDAMVVKTMWEAVYPTTNLDPPWAYTAHYVAGAHLFYQGMSIVDPDTNPRYPYVNTWEGALNEAIYIDPGNQGSCTFKLDNAHPVYSLGCFYFRPVTKADFATIQNQSSAIKDILQNCGAQTCYMIMVGVHIMTKETPSWVWMTFYWEMRTHDIPTDKWQMFVAEAAINDIDTIGNPYLEGPSSIRSNCMECHRRAVFSPASQVQVPTGIPTATSRDLQSPNDCFENNLQTHFLWTIAIYANNNETSSQPGPCIGGKSPKDHPAN